MSTKKTHHSTISFQQSRNISFEKFTKINNKNAIILFPLLKAGGEDFQTFPNNFVKQCSPTSPRLHHWLDNTKMKSSWNFTCYVLLHKRHRRCRENAL